MVKGIGDATVIVSIAPVCCYVPAGAPSLVGCLRLLISYIRRYPLLEVSGWKEKHDATLGIKDVFRSVRLCTSYLCFKSPVVLLLSSFGAAAHSGPGPDFTSTAFSLYVAKGDTGAKIVQAHALQSILPHGTLNLLEPELFFKFLAHPVYKM